MTKNQFDFGSPPSPELIRAVRESAGLTQKRAADLINVSLRAWQQWESTTPGDARQMHSAFFELFCRKAGFTESEISILADRRRTG